MIDDVNGVRVLERPVWNDRDGIYGTRIPNLIYTIEDYSDWKLIAVYDEIPKELLI